MERFIIIIVLGIILLILIILNNTTFVKRSTITRTIESRPSCTKTKFGCCPDGINSKVNFNGINCPKIKKLHPNKIGANEINVNQIGANQIGGCNGTRYGCCPDNRTPKMNPPGTNCIFNSEPKPAPQLTQKKPIGGCSGTQFGCCPDNITPKRNPNGTNCLIR